MLTTSEIHETLIDIRHFFGVYAIDRLPFVLLPKPGAVIVNLDASYLPGSHWVCLYFTRDGKGFYFDSFGRHPPAQIQSFLERNTRNWTWNRRIYQAEDSSYCGYYCILFVLLGPRFYNIFQPCTTSYNQNLIKRIFFL